MKNVTITLDEETAQWAHIYATQQGKSVSKVLGELLHQKRLLEETHVQAMQKFLSSQPTRLRATKKPLPKRDSLYAR